MAVDSTLSPQKKLECIKVVADAALFCRFHLLTIYNSGAHLNNAGFICLALLQLDAGFIC